MRAAYRVKRYTAGGVSITPHATHGEAWAAYEAARVESQDGVGLPPRYRVELWRVRGGKLIAYTVWHEGGRIPPRSRSVRG